MKILVLFNRNITYDIETEERVRRTLSSFLHGHEVYGIESYGGRYLPSFASVCTWESGEKDYKKRMRNSVIHCLSFRPDVVVTIGGDGLASYVADTILSSGPESGRPCLMGVAQGTANVGPIVSFTFEEIGKLEIGNLERVEADAVEVLDGGVHVAYGFNDVVLGDTLLSTLDGKTENISARALVEKGDQRIKIPGTDIASENLMVTLDGRPVPFPPAFSKDSVRMIAVSPLEFDRLYGRAVLGGLCSNGGSGNAGLCICGRNMVSMDTRSDRLLGFVPSFHLVFHEGETLSITGLGKDAEIVVDGNPYMRKNNEVSFRCIRGIVEIMRKKPR